MMREILSLLLTQEPHCDGGHCDGDEHDDTQTDIPPEILKDCEPLPYPSDGDGIHEPTQNEYAELRKKTRSKLSSRRYTRRRKEDSKIQASTLSEHQGSLTHLNEVEAMLNDSSMSEEKRKQIAEQLQHELDVLLNEVRSSASHTLNLAERMVLSSSYANRELIELATRRDELSAVEPVLVDWSPSDQLNKGIANVRSIIDVLSSRREKSPELWLNVFNGWRLVECRRRGSRYAVLASKKIYDVSRDTLAQRIWQQADDPMKRISMNLLYSEFDPVISQKMQLDELTSVFFSEELHEFPPPFLCRNFTSIHGMNQGKEEDVVYVKQSLSGSKHRPGCIGGGEIFGVAIQDAKTDDGRSCVDVDLVILYDTQSVCHAEQLQCEEPELCHRVLVRWEQTHVEPDSHSVRL